MIEMFLMKIQTRHGNGSQLTVDASGCKADLDNKRLVQKLLEELPSLLGMNKISKPVVLKHKAEKEEESGITGFVIIAESHIAIHTYPQKRFLSADVFSCREFDYKKVLDYIKNNFSASKIEHNLIQRGESEEYNSDEHLNPVKGFDIGSSKKIINVLEELKNIGFQGKHLGDAIDVLKKMKKENATIFMSFTSNMVSSGLREIFSQIAKENLVDVIITSAGAIEEDVMKCNKPFLLGDFDISDVELHRKGINRIGNIFVPDNRYEQLEDVLMPFFSELFEKQNKTGKMINPSELIFELGKKVQDENSILYWAGKNDIPIFCPGITDGALGLQLYFFKQKNPEFGIDVTGDMKKLADLVLHADKTAGIILGGGIAKHHLIGVNILREGLDYAVYVTTGSEGDGSLSGARPKEAKSWSKLKEGGNSVCIEGDATIVFPFLAIAMKEILK